MKFYKAKNAEIGEGMDATVVFHKENGDELIFVRSGADAFEAQNPKAKECTSEEADKLLAKAKIQISVPTRKEIRKTDKLTDEQMLSEIDNEATATVSISKEESEEGQTLTYFERREIATTEDFLKTQELQAVETPATVIETPQETVI